MNLNNQYQNFSLMLITYLPIPQEPNNNNNNNINQNRKKNTKIIHLTFEKVPMRNGSRLFTAILNIKCIVAGKNGI